jgi:hypothetical protein
MKDTDGDRGRASMAEVQACEAHTLADLDALLAGERARVDALLAEVQACEAHTLADLDALLAGERARVDALLAECRARGEGLVNP